MTRPLLSPNAPNSSRPNNSVASLRLPTFIFIECFMRYKILYFVLFKTYYDIVIFIKIDSFKLLNVPFHNFLLSLA